jgi:hypothetical protein
MQNFFNKGTQMYDVQKVVIGVNSNKAMLAILK